MNERTFSYAAVDASGLRRSGSVVASDRAAAYRAVRALGLTPTRLRRKWLRLDVVGRKGVTREDVANLTRELSVLVEARIPLARGIASIAESESKPALRDLLRSIAGRIASGTKISEAIGRHPEAFGDVYVASMQAAEQTGRLEAVTGHLADMLEKQIESGQVLRRALTYPAVVLAVVALCVLVIVMFVLPQFRSTFEAANVELPLATRLVQDAGAILRANWWTVPVGIGLLVAAARLVYRSVTGRAMIERLMTMVPVFRDVVICTTVGRFTRVLGIALGSGLSLIDAIELAGRSSGRPLFVKSCHRTVQRLRSGEPLSSALAGSVYIPDFAERLLGAGKDASEVERACGVVARHYERKADHTVKNLNTVIEPLLTVVLAAIVLFIALSVMLPMWQMATTSG